MRPELSALATGRGVHLGALTAVLADRYGDRIAVHDPAPVPGLAARDVHTFADLEDAVARFAAVQREHGVSPHERVLIAVDNRLDVALHALAAARLGAVAVPVNHRLSAHELDGVAEATGATRAVADPDVVDQLPDRLGVLATSGPDGQPDRDTVAGAPVALPPVRWRAGAMPVESPTATAVLLTTSGTTGMPKAAALTSRGLLSTLGRLAIAPVGADLGPLRRDRDRVLAALPLTHVMGFSVLLGALAAGVPMVRRSRFDAAEVLDLIEAERPNVFVAVPTMFADLEAAGAADRDLSSLQVLVSSADVLPPDRARRFQRYGGLGRVAGLGFGSAVLVDVFGMVELSGPAAVRIYPPSPVGSLPAPGFAVKLPGVELRVVGEDGQPVGRGTVGELQWRGENVLKGYEGRQDAGPDEDGWFGSGDTGRLLGAGLFQFVGRSKDRLKVGGFSVFPAEVEESLSGADGVAELAVVGVPDDRLGERLVAAVVPADGFDADRFLRFAKDQVAGYRRPTEVVEVDHLQRGANGKLDRTAITETVEQQLQAAGT